MSSVKEKISTRPCIQTHLDGITLEDTEVDMQRIYETLARTLGVAIKDSGITQRREIDPKKLRSENIGLADRILRDARAYKIIYPPPRQLDLPFSSC